MFRRYYGIPLEVEKDGYKGFMERFPILFQDKDKSMQETCMCWGIDCPNGWFHILEQLCTTLEFHNMEFTRNYGIAVIAEQVKEKFGTLRFYFTVRDVDASGKSVTDPDFTPKCSDSVRRIAVDQLDMIADELISEAENMTAHTCAQCGRPLDEENTVETKGWITYICKACDEKRQTENAKRLESEKVETGYDPK